MNGYMKEFLLARAKTIELGFPVQPFSLTNKSQRLTEEQGHRLIELADQELANNNGLKATNLALQCAQVSIAMKCHVESVTGMLPRSLSARFSHYSTPLIEVGSGELRQMAQAGTYHVRLTMPWGEIADFTLLASLAVLMGKTVDRVSPLAGFPESISPFKWKPLYVGTAAAHYILDPC